MQKKLLHLVAFFLFFFVFFCFFLPYDVRRYLISTVYPFYKISFEEVSDNNVFNLDWIVFSFIIN